MVYHILGADFYGWLSSEQCVFNLQLEQNQSSENLNFNIELSSWPSTHSLDKEPSTISE